MECSIKVNSDSDILKIKGNNFYHHINDIPERNILEYSVTKSSENEIIHSNLSKQIDSFYELIVIYKKESNKIRRTSNIKITSNITKVPKRVMERKKLPKFGIAKDSNDGVTTIGDEVFIVPPNANQNNDTKLKNNFNNKIVTDDMVFIKNNPTMKFSERKKLKTYQSKASIINKESEKPKEGKYISPGRRNERMNKKDFNKEKLTVFVSGFGTEFNRYDLEDLIPNYINVKRMSVPINKQNKCKGFAFIDLYNKEDMEEVINNLNGKLYNHMVLKANEKKNR